MYEFWFLVLGVSACGLCYDDLATLWSFIFMTYFHWLFCRYITILSFEYFFLLLVREHLHALIWTYPIWVYTLLWNNLIILTFRQSFLFSFQCINELWDILTNQNTLNKHPFLESLFIFLTQYWKMKSYIFITFWAIYHFFSISPLNYNNFSFLV